MNKNDEVYYKANLVTDWEKVSGSLNQVAVGGMGVFATNSKDEVYYRVGTNENPASIGTDWQKLSGTIKQVSVGSKNVWGVNSGNDIYTMENIKFVNSQIEFNWNEVPGSLKQIAALSYRGTFPVEISELVLDGVVTVKLCEVF